MMEVHYKVNIPELKKAMIDRGLFKLKDLAKESGIDRNTLGKVLNGKIIPSARVMYALVATLNLSYEKAGEIFFGPDLRVA